MNVFFDVGDIVHHHISTYCIVRTLGMERNTIPLQFSTILKSGYLKV